MGSCLGIEAEDFLTETLKRDKLQVVRAASARWLALIARRAAPTSKKRIFAMACARYDAEQGCMNVREAIESSFLDVYQSRAELERQHAQAFEGAAAQHAVHPLRGGDRVLARRQRRDMVSRVGPTL